MADFALLEPPNLISRKIWVIEKMWKFHTVDQYAGTAIYEFAICRDLLYIQNHQKSGIYQNQLLELYWKIFQHSEKELVEIGDL